MNSALRALARLLAPGQLIADPDALITYEGDAGLDRGRPDGVAFPRTADDVRRIVRWANEHGVPLIARGSGTGLSGGAVATRGGLVIECSRMDQVLAFDMEGRGVTVQPGMVNLALDGLVKGAGLYFPPDPASQRASSIGGNITENAGGPHCFKYGVTTNYVTGLEVVLADGHLARLGGPALDYPEYDLVGLLTGSEGTLGVITAANLRLVRNPPAVKTMMAAFDSVEAAGAAVSAIIARGLIPATLEMMDRQIMRIIEDFAHPGLPVTAGAALIVEVDGYPESVAPQIDEIVAILREHAVRDVRVAQTAAERDAIWYGRKSAAGAMSRLAPAYYLVDGTVPRSKLAATLAGVNQICADAELRVGYVFHAGDGNLHPLILIPDPSDRALIERVHEAGRRIAELCVSYDGSITGEHGVGIEKRDLMPLMYSPAELDVMREIKAVFDPRNLLNPDKIFPPSDDRTGVQLNARTTIAPRDTVTRRQGDKVMESGDTITRSPVHPVTVSPAHPLTPTSAAEAADLIRTAMAGGYTIRIRGGGTRSALLPPADLVLSTAALREVYAYALDDLYVTVGAGTPLVALQAELARDGMWVPLVAPDPESTIGGIVATGGSAPLRMRYGGVRDLVLAATVVLPDGRVIRAGRPVVKNVAGYDLPRLFAGAHGTLGLLADVTLKLAPLPRARATLIARLSDQGQGLDLCARLLRICMVASSLLLIRPPTLEDGGWRIEDSGVAAPEKLSSILYPLSSTQSVVVVYTAEGLAEDVAAELALVRSALKDAGADGTIVDETSGSAIWAAWMHAPRAGATQPGWTLRVGVPPSALPALLRDMNALERLTDSSFIADIANGLLYLRGALDIVALRRAAGAAGGYAIVLDAPAGAISDLDRWGHTPDSLGLMRALKSRWDPHGLLNPGAFLV